MVFCFFKVRFRSDKNEYTYRKHRGSLAMYSKLSARQVGLGLHRIESACEYMGVPPEGDLDDLHRMKLALCYRQSLAGEGVRSRGGRLGGGKGGGAIQDKLLITLE